MPSELRVPISPTSEFRDTLKNYACERLTEAGLDREEAEEAVEHCIEYLPEVLIGEEETTPQTALRVGLSLIKDVVVRDWLVNGKELEKEMKHAGRCAPEGWLGWAIRWPVTVRRTLAELLSETLLERPSLNRAFNVWLAGVAAMWGRPEAAVELLRESTGWKPPEPPERPNDDDLGDLQDYFKWYWSGRENLQAVSYLIELPLAAHVLSHRGADRDPVADLIERKFNLNSDEDTLRSLADSVKRGVVGALDEALGPFGGIDSGSLRKEGAEYLEALGVSDPESLLSSLAEDLRATISRVVEIAEASPDAIAEALLRASETIELGGERLGPEAYDPKWEARERAVEAFEQSLNLLDEAVEDVLSRTLEDMGKKILGEEGEGIARKVAELTTEAAKRALLDESKQDQNADSSPKKEDDGIAELIESVVREAFGRRRRS